MKPTLGYRMGKFLRRYPISIILSIMSMGLLVSLAVISTQSAISSASQIKLLEAERDKAEKIKDFVASIVRSANPMGMGPVDPPVGDLLVNAALRLDSMYGIDVEIRIELMTLIAESLLRLRGVNSTSNMIASIVDEAEYVLGENHPLTLHAKAVQFSSEQLPGGLLDWEDKVKLLPIQMSNVAEVDPEYLLLALSSRVFLATQEWQHDTAEKVAKHAYQMAVSEFGVAHPQTVEMQLMLSTSYRLNQQHKLAVDTAQHAHSLVFNKLKLGLDHPLAVKAKMTYGMALAEHDQIEAGLRELTSAVENSSVVFGPESQVTIFTQYDLARYQRRAGQLVESIKNHEKVLEFAKTDLGEQIPSYITVLSNTTRLLIEARHTDSSMIRAREFLRLVDVADNPLPYHVNRNAAQLAVTLSLMNQWQLTDARRELGKVDPGMQIKRPGTMLDPVYVEGILLRLEGRYTDALKMQYNTLARMNDTNERHRNEMHVQAEIGFNYLGMNEVDKAEDKLKTALTLFQQKQLQITPRQADVMVSLARVYLMTDRADQALSLLEAADQFWHEFNQTSWWAGQAAMWLSKGLDAVGDQQRSDVTRQRAKKILSKFYNTTNGNNVADANTKGLR